MEFAYNFAKEVNYFGIENEVTPSGDWEKFFIEKRGPSKVLFPALKKNPPNPSPNTFR